MSNCFSSFIVCWILNFVDQPTHENHENWYPTNKSDFTVIVMAVVLHLMKVLLIVMATILHLMKFLLIVMAAILQCLKYFFNQVSKRASKIPIQLVLPTFTCTPHKARCFTLRVDMAVLLKIHCFGPPIFQQDVGLQFSIISNTEHVNHNFNLAAEVKVDIFDLCKKC